jgi:superfamily II DNA helicase RecQ
MNNLAGKELCDAELGSEIERVVGFSPRAGQIQAIRKLVIDRKDLILVAPTGWGKSVVFQAIPALAAGICLMVMPLTLLEEDQVSSMLRSNS